MRALALAAALVSALALSGCEESAFAQACALPEGLGITAQWKISLMGDSITAGMVLVDPFKPVDRIQAWCPSCLVVNQGVGGNTTAQMQPRVTSNVVGSHFNSMWIMGGVNDLISTTDSAATIFGRLQSMYDSARADHVTVVPMTITPYGNNVNWTSAAETKRTTINSSILNYCSTNSITCYDSSTALQDSVDHTKLNATYDSGDGLHPNTTGSDVLVAGMEPYLK